MTSDTVTSAVTDTAADEPPSPGNASRAKQVGEPEPGTIIEIDAASDALHGAARLAAGDPAWMRERVRDALARIDAVFTRISVQIVGDDAMSRLHATHCDLDEPTDVLTFPESDERGAIEVDIAVCIDVAAREASERGHPFREELLLYVIHGLLHCAGHDDHDLGQYAAMHAREDAILRAIGVRARFGAADADADRDSREPTA